jgi:hypothetical protein
MRSGGEGPRGEYTKIAVTPVYLGSRRFEFEGGLLIKTYNKKSRS